MFSVVTPNRNRLDHLKVALSSWQTQALISEIIVVDYGSEKEIKLDDLPETKKVKIVRVEGTDDWRIGHAINIGVDYATNPYICKLDSDVILEASDWLNKLDLARSFFRGHSHTTVPNGEAIFSKEHLTAVGGYNEWLSGYGFDDSDFYFRLKSLGLEECYIPPSFLRTIDHTNAFRGSYKTTYRFIRIDDPSTRRAFDQYRNTLLSFMQKWDRALRTPYTVLSDRPQLVTVKTEKIRDKYKSQDAIAEAISFLPFGSTDEATKRHVEGLINWLINEAGGIGKTPPWAS
jgi:glycosyltransferase involved in cell wall biosynthesis